MQPLLIIQSRPSASSTMTVADVLAAAVGAAGQGHGAHPVGRVRRRLLLEEVLALDAVGVAHERDRAVAQVREEHVRDRAVVGQQVALRDLLVGEEHLALVRELELARGLLDRLLHGTLLYEALEDGGAQPAIARPFGELHLARERRLDPGDARAHDAAQPRRAAQRRGLAPQRLEPQQQVPDVLVREPAPAVPRVLEVVGGEQQRAEPGPRALAARVAGDQERRLLAQLDLAPVVAAPARPVGRTSRAWP